MSQAREETRQHLKGVKFQLCEHEPAANAGELLEKLHRHEGDQWKECWEFHFMHSFVYVHAFTLWFSCWFGGSPSDLRSLLWKTSFSHEHCWYWTQIPLLFVFSRLSPLGAAGFTLQPNWLILLVHQHEFRRPHVHMDYTPKRTAQLA